MLCRPVMPSLLTLLYLLLGLAGISGAAAEEHVHQHGGVAVPALRKKVAFYCGFTDRELDMNMNAMGPDYEWYVSGPQVQGSTGVLIIVGHGPEDQADNGPDLKILQAHVDRLKAKKQFAEKGLVKNPEFMQWVDSAIKSARSTASANPG